jgi:diguanylate cyclase (GGDEF)-like protein
MGLMMTLPLKIESVLNALSGRSKNFILSLSLCLAVAIGAVNIVTGFEISISLLYLIPISVAAWLYGSWCGIFVSVFCSAIWFAADYLSGYQHRNLYIGIWNHIMWAGLFAMFSYSLSRLKKSIDAAKLQSRTDAITGVANQRYFMEISGTEAYKASRYNHPLSLAYLDVDGFKEVNDKFGHTVGDTLIVLIAKTIKENIRASDLVARLGGDEFAILFPVTGGEQIKVVVRNMRDKLNAAVQEGNYGVTFSIGVVTFIDHDYTIDDVIKKADDLMYSVKNSGKNMIRYRVFF